MVRILIRLIYQFPINCQKKKIKKTKQFLLPIKILGKQYSTSEIFQSKCNAHIRTISNEYTKWLFFSLSNIDVEQTHDHTSISFQNLTRNYLAIDSILAIYFLLLFVFFWFIFTVYLFFLLENKFYARKE